MTNQKTIGFVIFKKDAQGIRYLLLHHGGEYWNFPKGRQEAGEDELTSAKRELQEETGITAIKVFPEYQDTYNYDFDSVIKNGVREKHYRQAIFFLAQAQEDQVKISDEHLDYGWFDYETALKRMFYQEGQNLLKRAHQFVLSQQDIVL